MRGVGQTPSLTDTKAIVAVIAASSHILLGPSTRELAPSTATPRQAATNLKQSHCVVHAYHHFNANKTFKVTQNTLFK